MPSRSSFYIFKLPGDKMVSQEPLSDGRSVSALIVYSYSQSRDRQGAVSSVSPSLPRRTEVRRAGGHGFAPQLRRYTETGEATMPSRSRLESWAQLAGLGATGWV